MTDIQTALGIVPLDRLGDFLQQRRHLAAAGPIRSVE